MFSKITQIYIYWIGPEVCLGFSVWFGQPDTNKLSSKKKQKQYVEYNCIWVNKKPGVCFFMQVYVYMHIVYSLTV